MWWLDVGPFWLVAVVLNLLFWAGLAMLVVWAVKQLRPGGPGQVGVPRPGGAVDTADSGDSAMRILEERFARGEIDADEFQRRREILRGGPAG